MKGKTPPQTQINDMSLPEAPCIINQLIDFEARLLAKRIPVIKITALPRIQQKGIIGSVINVPSDGDETCQCLLRSPTSSGIIPVKLKRKQQYQSHVVYEHVRPTDILEAFDWLKQNNIHYRHVVDSSKPRGKACIDEEFWDHLTQTQDTKTKCWYQQIKLYRWWGQRFRNQCFESHRQWPSIRYM